MIFMNFGRRIIIYYEVEKMNKYKLMQELKQKYLNDFLVLYNRYNTFKYWVFSDYNTAKKHYNKVNNSLLMDDNPCSLNIHLIK